MHVWRGCLAGVDKRIDTVDNILSAPKTQHGEALRATELRRSLRDDSEEKSGEQHDDSQYLFTVGCVDDGEVQKDAEKTHWKIKYLKGCSTKLSYLPNATHTQRLCPSISTSAFNIQLPTPSIPENTY